MYGRSHNWQEPLLSYSSTVSRSQLPNEKAETHLRQCGEAKEAEWSTHSFTENQCLYSLISIVKMLILLNAVAVVV